MSYAYYSSGERDEETKEYVRPNKWDSKILKSNELVDEQNDTKQVFYDLPKEFDSQYYIEKQNQYSKNDFRSPYWEWYRLRQYSKAVFDMYKNIAYQFYSTFSEDVDNIDLPKFVLRENKNVNFDALAKVLDNVENELIAQFSRNNRTVQAKINRHKPLENLQNYGMNTWLMYHILNKSIDIPLKNALRFKQAYLQTDENNSLDLIRIYRGCKILQRNYLIYLRPNFMKNQGHYLYEDMDITLKYDELVKSLGGVTSNECEEILSSIRPKIANIKDTSTGIKKLIEFYHRFDDIYRTVWEIKQACQVWQQEKGWYIFYDNSYGGDVDVFVRGEGYKKFLVSLLANGEDYDEIYLYDINKLLKELNNALDLAKPIHDISHQDELVKN